MKAEKFIGIEEEDELLVSEVDASSVPNHLLPKPDCLQPGEKAVVFSIAGSNAWFDKSTLNILISRLQKIVRRL